MPSDTGSANRDFGKGCLSEQHRNHKAKPTTEITLFSNPQIVMPTPVHTHTHTHTRTYSDGL